MQPDQPYFAPRHLTATIVFATAIIFFAAEARAADVVGTVASTAGAAVGAVSGALTGGGGGGNGGAGAGGGAAVPRGGGATAPSLAGFFGASGGGTGGAPSGGGANFRGDGGDEFLDDDDLMIRASSEGNVDYNVMLTKKIFSW